MDRPSKPPSWYRSQADDARKIADLVDGVDRYDLLGLAARWEELARVVVEGEYEPRATFAKNVVSLAEYRKRRRR
jgi:hypothetical protein